MMRRTFSESEHFTARPNRIKQALLRSMSDTSKLLQQHPLSVTMSNLDIGV
jgi:hypothetical protein